VGVVLSVTVAGLLFGGTLKLSIAGYGLVRLAWRHVRAPGKSPFLRIMSGICPITFVDHLIAPRLCARTSSRLLAFRFSVPAKDRIKVQGSGFWAFSGT